MPQQVTIESVVANVPVDIYVCDSMSANCLYVATVATFPYTFTVSDVYATTNFVIKIIDTQNCIEYQTIFITPTPTSTQTPTQTPTPSVSPTLTSSPTQTPTPTRTIPASPSPTQTITPSPTSTPVVYPHLIGRFLWDTGEDACLDSMTVTEYYTYWFDTPTIPIVGAKVWANVVTGVLVNPVNQNNKWRKMKFGSSFYAVQVDTSGGIINFLLCS